MLGQRDTGDIPFWPSGGEEGREGGIEGEGKDD